MKKYIKLFIMIIALYLCTACKAEYVLTYTNDNFKEELTITNIKDNEKNKFSRIYDNSAALKIDEEEYYAYSNDNGNIKLSYDIGEELYKTKLLEYCFENVYVVPKASHINIITEGKNYCSTYDIKIKLVTDKEVLEHNGKEESEGVYTWNTKNVKNINVLISKDKKTKDGNRFLNNPIIKILIVVFIILLIISIATIVYLNKEIDKKNKN